MVTDGRGVDRRDFICVGSAGALAALVATLTAGAKPARAQASQVSAVGENKTLNVGDPAPDFTLKSVGLKEISLRDYRGKNVVLLFYVLDWTPG